MWQSLAQHLPCPVKSSPSHLATCCPTVASPGVSQSAGQQVASVSQARNSRTHESDTQKLPTSVASTNPAATAGIPKAAHHLRSCPEVVRGWGYVWALGNIRGKHSVRGDSPGRRSREVGRGDAGGEACEEGTCACVRESDMGSACTKGCTGAAFYERGAGQMAVNGTGEWGGGAAAGGVSVGL